MARISLNALLAIVIGFTASLSFLAILPSSAGAQRSPLAEGEPCPSRMYRDRDELICRCSSTAGGNPVWGSDTYTDDSALCHAALHAGAIKETGGVIHVRRAPGQDSYEGSSRNGIASRGYGFHESSIVFDSPQELARTLGGVPLCPVLYTAASAGWSGNCMCDAKRSGPAWGSNPYAAGSAVCSAAVHAGLIRYEAGGVIHLAPAPAQSRYLGTTRNGFSTSDAAASAGFTLSRDSR